MSKKILDLIFLVGAVRDIIYLVGAKFIHQHYQQRHFVVVVSSSTSFP